MGLRRSVVEPRIGRVKFTRARLLSEKAGTSAILYVGLGLLLFFLVARTFFLESGSGLEAWTMEWAAAIPTTLLAVMALLVAALTGLIRFLGYGALLLAIGTITTPLGVEPPGQILGAGTIITLVGLTMFVRFLSRHPIPADPKEAP
jgi:hypothetical protein